MPWKEPHVQCPMCSTELPKSEAVRTFWEAHVNVKAMNEKQIGVNETPCSKRCAAEYLRRQAAELLGENE